MDKLNLPPERQFLTPLHAQVLTQLHGYNTTETPCEMVWQKAFNHKDQYILYNYHSNLYDKSRPVLPALTITETIGFFKDEIKGRRFFHSSLTQLANNKEFEPEFAE